MSVPPGPLPSTHDRSVRQTVCTLVLTTLCADNPMKYVHPTLMSAWCVVPDDVWHTRPGALDELM